jgi:transforming growth factor-beta-induced protein
MKTLKRFTTGILVLAMVVGTSFTYTATAKDMKKGAPEMNVVEIAISDERFSILVEAVSKAGLVEALSAEGPYTVFAPTNDAFEMLFKDLGVNGIEDLSADQLTPILLYHVVSGKVMAADVTSGKVSTLNEDAMMYIDASSKGVTIDKGSDVVITDIVATNGVIHVIDKVLIPQTKTAKSSSGCN